MVFLNVTLMRPVTTLLALMTVFMIMAMLVTALKMEPNAPALTHVLQRLTIAISTLLFQIPLGVSPAHAIDAGDPVLSTFF